jgi:hypothetical protein
MRMRERGVEVAKNKLLKCGSDCNGFFIIRLGGRFWDYMLTKWDKAYNYNFIILCIKPKLEKVLIWLRVSSLFSWKITYVWSPKSFLKKIYKERICAYQIWRSLIVVMGFVLFLAILCNAQSSVDLWSNFCFQCKLQK